MNIIHSILTTCIVAAARFVERKPRTRRVRVRMSFETGPIHVLVVKKREQQFHYPTLSSSCEYHLVLGPLQERTIVNKS